MGTNINFVWSLGFVFRDFCFSLRLARRAFHLLTMDATMFFLLSLTLSVNSAQLAATLNMLGATLIFTNCLAALIRCRLIISWSIESLKVDSTPSKMYALLRTIVSSSAFRKWILLSTSFSIVWLNLTSGCNVVTASISFTCFLNGNILAWHAARYATSKSTDNFTSQKEENQLFNWHVSIIDSRYNERTKFTYKWTMKHGVKLERKLAVNWMNHQLVLSGHFIGPGRRLHFYLLFIGSFLGWLEIFFSSSFLFPYSLRCRKQ